MSAEPMGHGEMPGMEAGTMNEAEASAEKKEQANREFMQELEKYLPREKLDAMLAGRQVTGGKLDMIAYHAVGPSRKPEAIGHLTPDTETIIPFVMAELEVEGGGKVFVSNTPSQMDQLMMYHTGVVMNRERWTYNFDGKETTVVESPTGELFTIAGEQGKDMDGLREQLKKTMPYEEMMKFSGGPVGPQDNKFLKYVA